MVSSIGSSSKPFGRLNQTQSEDQNLRGASRVNARTDASGDAVKTTLSSDSNRSEKTSAPGTSGFAERAADATAEIERLRAEQDELADKAATLAESEESANLDEQYQDLQNEIERVASSATYRGQNVLTGGTFGSREDGGSVVSVPNSQSIAQDPGFSLSSRDGAEAAAEETGDLVSSASRANSSSERAVSEANSRTRPSGTTSNGQPTITSAEEADAVVQRVAEELNRTASAANPRSNQVEILVRSISGNLDPARATELLRQ